MIESLFWGSAVRIIQVIVFSALWVVMGFVIAAVFRVMVGAEKTRATFGNSHGWQGIFYGWLWGMLLPVCSLGAIPVVRELHRSGVRGGTLIAFALTAPLFNPLSVLYGLTLSDPIAILVFALGTLIIVSLVGFFWDRLFQGNEKVVDTDTIDPPIDYGLKRIVATFKTMSEMVRSPSSMLIFLGISGSVAISVILPHGAMSTMLERDNWLAPLTVAILGTPIYSTPLLAMSQIGSMFQHGNSIGAAFSLLIFGAGVNLGLIVCFFKLMGTKKTIGFLSMLAAISLGLAYLISEPLFPKGIDIAGHTHAFDVYTNPFTGSSDYSRAAFLEIETFWRQNEFGGSYLLAGLIGLGILFPLVPGRQRLNQWLSQRSPNIGKDIILPDWIMRTVAIVGLFALSMIGCFVYYPPPGESLEQMQHINLDVHAASRGEWDIASRGIELQESWSRLLEVGYFIRKGELSEFHRMKARILRERLELLRHAVEDQDLEEAKQYVKESDRAYRRLSRAFQANQ